jgi:hypothetical protein
MQIFDLVFDLGEILHRQLDLWRAWEAGLMTSGDAKLLSDLFFAEDDGESRGIERHVRTGGRRPGGGV